MSNAQTSRSTINKLVPLVVVSSLAAGTLFLYALYMPRSQAQATVMWEQTQGPSGGKINVLLIGSQNPSIIYAGTDGGIYASQDGGATWQYSSDGLPAGQGVMALAIDPTASHVLYAGTYAGVYRSINSGRTWSQANNDLTRKLVFSLAVDPINTSIVYAGTDGQVFKSVDSGNTWSASSEGLAEETIWSLVVDYVTPGILYVGTDGGVFKSTDGGQRWQRTSDGMPDELRVQALAIDSHFSNVLYAATEAGVYRSADAALTWQTASRGMGKNIVHSLAIDPNNTSKLYAAVGTQGVWQSANSGGTWEPTVSKINELVLTLAINPLYSQVIYAGTGRGIYYSNTAGQRWEPRNEGIINTNVLLLVAVPERPGHLYTATGLDVQKTIDKGETWFSVNEGLAHPNVLALAVDPLSLDAVYAGTWYSEIYQSVNSGRTWRLMNEGLARDAPINALVVQPPSRTRGDRTSGTLYAGTNGAGVFSSTDGGISWKAINKGLDDLYVQVLALASIEEGNILYAGTRRGIYRLSLAGGIDANSLLWQPVQHGLPHDEVRSIVVDERSPNIIYAATSTGIGEIHRSTDGGITWTAMGRGSLPTNIKIQALALNSLRGGPNILYAGTDGGIFRSEDGGLNWRAINDGLPPRANVLTLLTDDSHLYAGISNGGVYRGMSKGTSLIFRPLFAGTMLGAAVLATVFFVRQWLLYSSECAQDQVFERSWPLWREEIRQFLQNQNEVKVDALPHIPKTLRLRALQQYMQEYRDDNLILRLNPPMLEPANSLQVWDFLRNWHAAQKRLKIATAFRPVASRIAEQLCQLLGFTLLDTRSYKNLHGYVIKAPALRLKMPPMFPMIFLPKCDITEQDISDLRALMEILGVSSYLALLIIPDDEISAGQKRELSKMRLQKLTRGIAHDFVVMDFDDLYRIFVAKDAEKRFVRILLGQVDLTVVSPYITSGSVPENMFFGREYELKTITRMIKDNSFAIVGGRKIGKTSFLNKLHRSFTDAAGCYSLYLDCQGVQNHRDFCDVVETMWKLPLPDCAPENLMRLVARIKQSREGQRIIILLDEVDGLLRYDIVNQERFFKASRALSQEGCCRFIFCGGRTLYASLHDSSSALVNFCNTIRLSCLNPRDTGRIVLEPMQEMGIGFEDASKLVQGIIDLSACHPNIVQYICQELIIRINARGDRFVTLADLDAIGRSTQFSEYLIELMWGDATALERLITLLMLDKPSATLSQVEAALHDRGIVVSSAAIQQALDNLVFCSVLNREEQEYYFTALAFPAVVRATQDVESLIGRLIQFLEHETLIETC